MRTLLVTSAVTFVPQNYDNLTLPLAKDPHIVALVVIDNRHFDIVLKALLLIVTLAAPAMGWQLLKNFFDNSLQRKQNTYQAAGKPVLIVKDINSKTALSQIKELTPDLILNARTRSFFKRELLAIPKLGCINIHHGLLPDQRGLMCDFWAHLHNTPAGFSIHQMTSKLDDGALLKVVEVPSDKKDYLGSLNFGATMEAQAASQVIASINAAGVVQGTANIKTEKTIYRSNPRLRDFYRLRIRGVRI